MVDCRADVVGSLLRPPELLQAREQAAAGAISPSEFKRLEDRAVDAAVDLEQRAGLLVATDGEMRRLSFQCQMVEAVEGFGPWNLDAFLWGDWRGSQSAGDRRIDRPATLGVVSKLRRRRHLCAEEFVYLRGRCSVTPKITLPSPSLWANFWSAQRSASVYPTLDSLLADVVDILRDEVAELVRLGATYIQIDAPHYASMLDARARAFYEAQGWTLDRWLSRGIELDNAVIDGFPHVTFGLHLCRGNQQSRWLAEGGYDLIAGPVFRGLHAGRLLLEYDDERSGSFEPLAGVPEDKTVVLGLVTTKTPRPETPAQLEARIREASRFIPLERLALSPQCGFAASILGNLLTPQDQERKLRVIVETANRVWGQA